MQRGFTFWAVLDQVSTERDLLPDLGVHSSCSTMVNENLISSIYMKLENNHEVSAQQKPTGLSEN